MSSLGSPNPFLIAGKKAYEVERSLRFNDGNSAYLSRTPSSAGNRKVWTWSAWVKRGNLGLNTATLFHAYDGSSSNRGLFNFQSDDTLNIDQGGGGGSKGQAETVMQFKDISAWYHIVICANYSDSTASDRIKVYVNGTRQTLSFDVNYTDEDGQINGTFEHQIGQHGGGSYFDGYIAENHFVDGTALDASSFGETDATTGQWNPKKYTGSYGTNGFYLNFSDNSGTTATTLGKDSSGQGNNYTPNNFNVAANLANDSMPDTPTINFCTLNPLNATNSINLPDANLVFDQSSNDQAITGTFFVTSGKWYWEIYKNSGQNPEIGICGQETLSNKSTGGVASRLAFITNGGNLRTGSSSTATLTGGSAQTGAGWIKIAVDMDNKKIWFSDTSGNYFNSGNPATGANAAYDFSSHATKDGWTPYVFMGTGNDHNCYMNFGQFDLNSFSSNIPTGFKTLSSDNLPNPTIKLPDKYFDTVLYTGNGGTQSITGLNFSPDMVWLKCRSDADDHTITDTVRGNTKAIYPNSTNSEHTSSIRITSFDSGGFSLGSSGDTNTNGRTFVGWNWNGGGSTASNSDGSITSSVRANTTAGFSIVGYTGTGSNATVGHGLGVAPKFIITKQRSTSGHHWRTYHASIGATKSLYLDLNNAESGSDSGFMNNTEPTSTVFSIGTDTNLNENGETHIAYCFSEVAGYSKAGSYTGNGSSDGTFVYTGFRPAWVMVKRTNNTGTWQMADDKRLGYNPDTNDLFADLNEAENTGNYTILLSNGFKFINSEQTHNGNGDTFIYLAFAESPFKNARAR
jgi:hypothetical protein